MRGIFLMGVCLSTSEELFRVKFTVALMHFEVREGGNKWLECRNAVKLGLAFPWGLCIPETRLMKRGGI